MDQKQKDKGMLMVLLERYNKQRHPRVMALKKKVDAGEPLPDYELKFIKEMIDDGKKISSLIERNPEFKDLAAKATELVDEILRLDLENKKNIK